MSAVWHWLSTAFDVYVLHVERGDGYLWWSGFGGRSFGAGTIIAAFTVHWNHINCHHKGCWRRGHRHPEYGWPACRHHWHEMPEHLRPGSKSL